MCNVWNPSSPRLPRVGDAPEPGPGKFVTLDKDSSSCFFEIVRVPSWIVFRIVSKKNDPPNHTKKNHTNHTKKVARNFKSLWLVFKNLVDGSRFCKLQLPATEHGASRLCQVLCPNRYSGSAREGIGPARIALRNVNAPSKGTPPMSNHVTRPVVTPPNDISSWIATPIITPSQLKKHRNGRVGFRH